MDAAARVIRPGVTTDEIDRVVHDVTIAAGMSLSFSRICCINTLFLGNFFGMHATRHPAGEVEPLIIPFPPT